MSQILFSPIRWVWSAALIFSLSGVSATCHAATVAYWQFEPSALTADSAASNTLTNTGVTSSVDVAPLAAGVGSTGSASFDGTQTLFRTVGNLDLTPYTDLTVEWFAKTTQTTIATIWEHSGGSGAGALGGFINDLLPNGAEFFQRGTSGTYVDDAPRPLDGDWHHYAAVLDGSETGAARLTLYIDSIDVGTFNGTFSPPSGTPGLQSALLTIGNRNGTQFRYEGLLDELRISDTILTPDQFLNAPIIVPIPEPNSLLLVGLGTLLLTSARRKVRRRNENV